MMNTYELQYSNDLVIEDIFLEEKMSYSSYSVIYDNSYNDKKTTIKYQIMS